MTDNEHLTKHTSEVLCIIARDMYSETDNWQILHPEGQISFSCVANLHIFNGQQDMIFNPLDTMRNPGQAFDLIKFLSREHGVAFPDARSLEARNIVLAAYGPLNIKYRVANKK